MAKPKPNWYLIGIRYLLRCWLPYLIRKPHKIKYLFPWFQSLRRGANPIKDQCPIMPFEAIEWLDNYLTKDMTVFEWGCGGSTLWIAKRARIISTEHCLKWWKKISEKLPSGHQLILAEDWEYTKMIDPYKDNSFDLIIIDGEQRAECFIHAISKVRKGGYLLMDDYRYSDKNREGCEEAEANLDENWSKRIEFMGPEPYSFESSHPERLRKTSIWQRL